MFLRPLQFILVPQSLILHLYIIPVVQTKINYILGGQNHV